MLTKKQVTDKRILSLMAAAENAGGSIASDMNEALGEAGCEHVFAHLWLFNLKLTLENTRAVYNGLARALGEEELVKQWK